MAKSEPHYPPAPELQGELLLDVFTHRSLRQEGGGGDNERYVVLGEKVLEASMTHCVFLCYPQFGRQEIEVCVPVLCVLIRADPRNQEKVHTLLTDETFETWTNHYRFRDKLRYNANAADEVNSPQGAREIFYAYVGGVFSQATGPLTVNAWVYRLIVAPQDRQKFDAKLPFFPSQKFTPPLPSHTFPMQPPPPPPAPAPPTTQQLANMYPLRSRTSSMSSSKNMSTDDLSGASSTKPPSNGRVAYLPLFNEITTQRGLSVQYPADKKGPHHAPCWVVKCVGEYRADADPVSPIILINVQWVVQKWVLVQLRQSSLLRKKLQNRHFMP